MVKIVKRIYKKKKGGKELKLLTNGLIPDMPALYVLNQEGK